MIKRNVILTVGVLAMAFVGGVVGQWLFLGRPALAQGGQAQGPVTVTAERFELVDEAGNLRGLFHVDEGVSALILHDDASRPRIGLGVQAKGPSAVCILDTAGQIRAACGEDAGRYGVSVYDANGQMRGRFGYLDELDSAVLAMYSAADEPRVMLQGSADTPALMLLDGVGRPRVALGVTPTGAGVFLYDLQGTTRGGLTYLNRADGVSLEFNSPTRTPRVVLRASEDTPELSLYDADGEMRTSVRHSDEAGPGVTLFDADGNEIWQTP